MASTDLVWEIVRQNNKYLQKRNGIRLSNDPFNNSGKATKRHAGFMQAKAAVVRVKGQKEVYVAVKDGSNLNKPRKQWVKKATGVKASDASRAVSAVRADLADVAFNRARKLTAAVMRGKKVRAATKVLTAKRTFKRNHKREKKAKKN